ncbi:hypothetical protein FRC02_010123 [Tulasnella sp. 418]|nr:hypothetical protein FRC02_010123 [Tulasnella sp. 418]
MPGLDTRPQTAAKVVSGREPKTLVLCFDGTANEFDDTNTNVVKVFSMLDKTDTSRQVVYYQTGIGTYGPPGLWTTVGLTVARFLDYAFAWYLGAHVMGGYKFIMDNYETGDKICLFGFSRGAYTARALAGMLYRVGLLPRDNVEHIPFAWKLYTKSGSDSELQAETGMALHSVNFKYTFSRRVEVDFLGIWDTVGSVGLVGAKLPHITKNDIVKHVAHALSLDEMRAKFRHKSWKVSNPDSVDKSLLDDLTDTSREGDYAAIIKAQAEYERSLSKRGSPSNKRTVNEVWFAGHHCDVGGGNTNYLVEHDLSHISLRWMVREAMKVKWDDDRGLINFDEEVLRIYGISREYPFNTHSHRSYQSNQSHHLRHVHKTRESCGNPDYPFYRDANLTDDVYREREKRDADSQPHSPYRGWGLLWHFVELLPVIKTKSKEAKEKSWFIRLWPLPYYPCRPNFWRKRNPRKGLDATQKIRIHSSVKSRMDKDPSYKLNKVDLKDVEWVDTYERQP